MRRRKRANLSRGMLFTWGMLIGLAFLLVVPQETGSRMQLTYARVFRWPLAVGHGVTLAARPTTLPKDLTPEKYNNLLTTQQRLQTTVANLQARLANVQQRNAELAGLRQKPGWEKLGLRQAHIIQSQSQWIIDCGTDDGVAEGQFAVSLSDADNAEESGSVIGVVSDVTAKTARIRLITDKGSYVFASFANVSARGTMEGLGNGTARVTITPVEQTVPIDQKVRKGDPVYAEKIPGIDVPVIAARVASCLRNLDNPYAWDITVEPVYDITTAGEVAVIVPAARP